MPLSISIVVSVLSDATLVLPDYYRKSGECEYQTTKSCNRWVNVLLFAELRGGLKVEETGGLD